MIDWFRSAVHDCTEEMKRIAADPETKPKDKWKGRWNDEQCWRKYFYDRSLENQIVAGIPHTFGWGGIHGAIDHPVHVDGYLVHVDVGSYYPSMLIAHQLVTRAAANDNYKKVYEDCSPSDSIAWGFAEMVQGFMSGQCPGTGIVRVNAAGIASPCASCATSACHVPSSDTTSARAVAAQMADATSAAMVKT